MEDLNVKAEAMFTHMKDISNILAKKTVNIENAVTLSE
jgi:hypothetical protein